MCPPVLIQLCPFIPFLIVGIPRLTSGLNAAEGICAGISTTNDSLSPLIVVDKVAMWSYQGKPTIFGNPVCDDEAHCENKEVIQYDPESDSWVMIGQMLESRTYHAVIEVPAEFCEVLNPNVSSGSQIFSMSLLSLLFLVYLMR